MVNYKLSIDIKRDLGFLCYFRDRDHASIDNYRFPLLDNECPLFLDFAIIQSLYFSDSRGRVFGKGESYGTGQIQRTRISSMKAWGLLCRCGLYSLPRHLYHACVLNITGSQASDR
jgi:hypothetical protein